MSNLLENINEEVRELQRVVIKEELVALTGGKPFDAALLNNLIFWSGIVEKMDNNLKKQIKQMESRNTKQTVINKKKKQIRNGWFYKTGEEILAELMGWGSASTISRTIETFIKNGWMEKGNNPDSTQQWDRTKWYKIHVTKIAADLHELGYALEGYSLVQEPVQSDEKQGETASLPILHSEKCILQDEKSILHSERTIPEGLLQKVTSEKELEEEEIIPSSITESMILDLMNQQITEREITNQKTIKAILAVSEKCKAIGTTDIEAAENYVIKVVEEKMSKLGQKQKVRQGKAKVSGAKPIRNEMVPGWVKEQKQENEFVGQPVSREPQQNYENEQQRIEDERKRLNDMLAKYRRE
ncbi:hypothetical protein [Bacillus cereus]|uniref:DnaD domain-containing protein n=1 Tax=Bacillus cereus VD184 TaxID=1053242 RepID=A0A9W5R252_BACCE|nr:hypothetical protein [Bacillus cereus]EOQ04516.1 hypothetical protein IKC_06018 [Bacillus cereus VD184]